MNYLFLALTITLALLITWVALRYKEFKGWRPILVAVAISGLVNVLLSSAFFALNALQYRAEFLSAVEVGGMPIEALLLSFVLPYAFIVIYVSLHASYPLVKADKYSLSISNVIMGLSCAMIFFAYNKVLALITFSFLLLTLFYVEYKNQLRFMLQFYRSYAAAFILFLLIFLPIHVLSIYKYTTEQTIKLKIAYIPFESYFYFLWMGLVAVTVYELTKRRI
jgi:energy-converting hydrogenase Eha subunit E